MKDVIAIFDIGKTNKKAFLFDDRLKPVFQSEQNFAEISDENGSTCDNIDAISKWMHQTIRDLAGKPEFNIKALNFSTYGASLMHLDSNGKVLTPLYNYLKPMPDGIMESMYSRYGGVTEFSRQTASPALGFLNSGLQILWLKKMHPEIFKKVYTSLHFPQYCSYIFTGKKVSEYTSIGCHTAMWNFDNMKYHPWLMDEGIQLPAPVSNDLTFAPENPEFKFKVGTGIHDSSASLAPYIMQSKEKFILISTGTWCINMNPFNHDPLTKEQLNNDCLSYMSISQKPVKSSRLFMGHIHHVNMEKLAVHFHVDDSFYRQVKFDEKLFRKCISNTNRFFKTLPSGDFIDHDIDLTGFDNFTEAYHQLVYDLTLLCEKSIKYVMPEKNDIKNIFVSGGFSRNEIFVRCLSSRFHNKNVITSDFDNSSALGAALVVYKEFGTGKNPEINLI